MFARRSSPSWLRPGADFRDAQGGQRGQRRRLSKLSCAGWIPHDRGFVLRLPQSRGRAPVKNRLIAGREGSSPRPAARLGRRYDRLAVVMSETYELPVKSIAARSRLVAETQPPSFPGKPLRKLGNMIGGSEMSPVGAPRRPAVLPRRPRPPSPYAHPNPRIW